MVDQNSDKPYIPSKRALRDQIALLTFIEDLIKERKDPNITPETLPKVKQLLLKEVNEYINRHMLSLLTDKDQVELGELLDKNIPDEELDAFFAKKIPNLEAEVASVLLDFKNVYLYPLKDQQPETKVQVTQNQVTNGDKKDSDLSGFPPPAPVPVDRVN